MLRGREGLVVGTGESEKTARCDSERPLRRMGSVAYTPLEDGEPDRLNGVAVYLNRHVPSGV